MYNCIHNSRINLITVKLSVYVSDRFTISCILSVLNEVDIHTVNICLIMLGGTVSM